MKNKTFKEKLKSRKFWACVSGLASGIALLIIGCVDKDPDKIRGGVILCVGSVVGYIVGEGVADAAHVEQKTIDNENEKQ